ncbi:hypothetical protein BHE74_00001245 [Ensete ventricosum]|nr:hypothetical protein BHE74_00001245 [Ensete ventricosum]
MHPPLHYLMRDHVTTSRRSLRLLRFVELLSLGTPQYCGPLHMILHPKNQDLSLPDTCPLGATFLFAFFPLEVSETTIPLYYSTLLNKLCIILPSQMHL